MSATAGPLADAANAEARDHQNDIAHLLAGRLIGRAEANRATGGSGRIEASVNLIPYADIDPVYVEARVSESLTKEYVVGIYDVTVKYFDTRARLGGPDHDDGEFRLFFWAIPVPD